MSINNLPIETGNMVNSNNNVENVIDMLRVERKWNLTKYKIKTREDGKKRKK